MNVVDDRSEQSQTPSFAKRCFKSAFRPVHIVVFVDTMLTTPTFCSNAATGERLGQRITLPPCHHLDARGFRVRSSGLSRIKIGVEIRVGRTPSQLINRRNYRNRRHRPLEVSWSRAARTAARGDGVRARPDARTDRGRAWIAAPPDP
jgi:hypothetical protein